MRNLFYVCFLAIVAAPLVSIGMDAPRQESTLPAAATENSDLRFVADLSPNAPANLRFASTETPEAIIIGPREVSPGDLVILDGSTSKGGGHVWKLIDSEKSYLSVDGGVRVVFASGASGRFTFILAVATDSKASIAQHVVTIGKPVPPVPPDPDPIPPTPEPVLPEGKYGLAKLARDWAKQVQGSTVPSEAQSLAGSFASQASAIAAGVVNTPAEILANSKSSNQSALGSRSDAWKPGFFTQLAAKLAELDAAGTLRVAADYQVAWEEIALGLKAVK